MGKRLVLSLLVAGTLALPALAQSNGPATIRPSGPTDQGGRNQPVITNPAAVGGQLELQFGPNEFSCHEGIPLLIEVFGNGSAATVSYDGGPAIGVGQLMDIDGVKYSNGRQSVQVDPDRIIYEDGDFRDDCFLPGSTGAANVDEEFEQDFGGPPFEMEYPLAAKTGGGVVRGGPGMDFARITSLPEYADITILEPTGVDMNGYPWFRIGYRGGREGFMWGGIICSIGQLYVGTYDLCP